jgi:hypothetical protein
MSESLFAGSRPMPKDPTRTYKIVVVKDGTYAVEVMPAMKPHSEFRDSGLKAKPEPGSRGRRPPQPPNKSDEA